MEKIFLQSLGCPKNLVDSEVMLGLLQSANYRPVNEPESADILIINTCGFIQSAVTEAIDEILHLAEIKTNNPGMRLVVTGCMVQRYRQALLQEIPEVDLFIGTDGFQNIVEELHKLTLITGESSKITLSEPLYLMDSKAPRTLSTPNHRAYLKITEGCNNRCSYCLIPSLRGGLRSRSMADLVEEARRLAKMGVQELTLVGQDLTSYGVDNRLKNQGLALLLKELLRETDIPWLRLLYLYPTRVNDDLLELIANEGRLLPYFDIPLQHISKEIVQKMNRSYDRKIIEKIIGKIRGNVPDSALRTTFMVGFPGETEEHIREVETFMREMQFDHVGVFTYSNEEGCAAEHFDNQIDEDVKEERKERLMALQAGISLERNQRFIGRIEPILVEGLSLESDLLLEGRTRFQAPEIDGCVYITSGNCNAGEIVRVKITEAHHYDLVGEIVEG